MGRIVVSFFVVMVILLSTCETTRAQTEFKITESNETVIVGNVTADGRRNFRFEGDSPICQEILTIDESGVISTTRGIDRESQNANEGDRISCTVGYSTNDGNNNTIRIEVIVADVNDNSPEFSFVNQTVISIPENMKLNETITVFTVKDPDKEENGTISDVVMSGVDERFFYLVKVREDNLRVRVTLLTHDVMVDFESNQQFNVTITATDRGDPAKVASVVLVINVEDMNEYMPTFVNTQYNFRGLSDASPIGTPIGTVSAMDDDKGRFGIILYNIISTSHPYQCRDGDGLFAINSTTGVLYLNQSANDSIDCEYIVRVRASNNHTSSVDGIATVNIFIARAQLSITLRSKDYDNDILVEGRSYTSYWVVTGGGSTYTIQFDGEEPEYDINDWLRFGSIDILLLNVDREKTPIISGTLTVHSDNVPPLPAMVNFSLTVLDINDNSPMFVTTNFSIRENNRVGLRIGSVVAVDPDEGENGTISYTLFDSSELEGLITLYSNGSLVVNSPIDYEQVEVIEFLVVARDHGTPSLSNNETVYIHIENLNDNSPVFMDKNLTQLIYTSTPLPFTWKVTATDDDSGEFGVVRYDKVTSSASNDASSFVTLDRQSGQLTIEKLPTPSSTPYQLTVNATDGGNASDSRNIIITVWTDFCQDTPCVNGGTCTNELNSYKCECPEEYGGRNCSILKNPCEALSTYPCRNGGMCRNTEDQLDYRCTCLASYSGKDCTYSTVSFKPRSYQQYQLTGISADSSDLHISMQIAPKYLDGLLMYIVGEDEDFVSMELENGRVAVHTSDGFTRDNTVMGTANGIWYHITVIKTGIDLSLSVMVASSSSDNPDANNNRLPNEGDVPATTVFIGGLSADLPVPYQHAKSRDYVGCMRDFIVNGERVQLSDENGDDRRMESHNVEDGCAFDSSRSCEPECESEGCIDFLNTTTLPYCDCVSVNCTTAVPNAVGFTGQANLIVKTQDDFFLATQQSRQKLQATEPDVRQTVSFTFHTTTKEAVLLSAVIQSQNSNLRVFWYDNNSLNYDIYQDDTRCGHVSVTGNFNDGASYTVQMIAGNRDTVTLTVKLDDSEVTNITTARCSSNNLFVEFPSSTITVTGRPAMQKSISLPDKDFHGCISDLTVDEITVPLAKEYESEFVMLQGEGSVNGIHNQCKINTAAITREEDDGLFLDLYIIVIIVVAIILLLIISGIVAIFVGRKCLHPPNKSRFDMSQEMPDISQDSPPNTLNYRKKAEFDNASVGHYQEEGEEAMPDETAISFDSLRKSTCTSSGSGTASSGETGFHTGSERDHTSDAGYPEPSSMVNEETPSEVQESEYSTFISDSDITSAVEQTLSPLDVQLLGSPNVLGIPPQAGRNMTRKPSPGMKDPSLPPMERKISPFHHHSGRFSMSTIESGSELSLGPPPADSMLNYPHQSSIQHEPQLPGLKTLCGPDFNPISYWEQQSRLKPSIDPDYPLQRLSLASGRGTEDPSSVSIASTLEEQHEFASQGGGEGEATNMRDGLESDHELDYRLEDLHIPEYESMTLSQSTLVGGSEEYFPDATVKPCHPIVPVHDNSVSSNSPYHSTLPDHMLRHSPQSISSSSTSYDKNSRQRLLSEQDLSAHDRYYERSRTVGASKPSHMISDHRLHAQYSTTSTASSASTPQTSRGWRSEDPINV